MTGRGSHASGRRAQVRCVFGSAVHSARILLTVMSRPQIPTKSSVASRTKYELLAVDDADDESEQEEQEEEQPEPTQESVSPFILDLTSN